MSNKALEHFSYHLGRPALCGRIRSLAEDFQVSETLGFTADGEGEHRLLRVRKRDANTDWVAGQLARLAGVARSAVGYAGLKDRRAVAEQWFSLPATHPEPDWTHADFQVLQSIRHRRKLRRGALADNAFRIVIRDLQGDVSQLQQRFAQIQAHGVPNYFGEQRFGRNSANLSKARALFEGAPVRDRYRRGLYLSAARAWLFNRVLSQRVADATWQQALDGEVLMLAGSRSWFLADGVDGRLNERLRTLDIHPTGPLWGAGAPPTQGAVLAMERRVAGHCEPFCQGLAAAGLRQERRALRLALKEAALESAGPGVAVLGFRLPPGGYATAVLRELLDFSD